MGTLAVIFISKEYKCSSGTLTSGPGLTTQGAGVDVCSWGQWGPLLLDSSGGLQVLVFDTRLVTRK